MRRSIADMWSRSERILSSGDIIEPLSRVRERGWVRVCQVAAKSGALTRRCAPPSPAGGRGAAVDDMSVLVHGDSGSSPRISRMPSPGASLIEISDSLNVTPPSTGSKAHSDGPSRSTLVISPALRSEEHTSELQSLLSISYAVFCL